MSKVTTWLRWRQDRPHPSQFWTPQGEYNAEEFESAWDWWYYRRPRSSITAIIDLTIFILIVISFSYFIARALAGVIF